MLHVNVFHSVRKIIFGLNAITEIGKEAKYLGKKVLIVTDKNLLNLGVIDKASILLKDSGLNVEVFDECEAEPRLEIYEKAKNTIREMKVDLVIGIGGGSNMDIAKVTSALATNEGDAYDYLMLGHHKFTRDRLPLIQVPTTAGTGSEATPYAVVTVNGEKWDFNFVPPKLLCDVAIVDPMISKSTPPKITATTAVDALSHSIESILNRQANFMTMPYALKAAKNVSRYARRAYSDGEDLEARYYMSLAAMYAGIAICNSGTVLGHAVAYTFAAQHRLPHGLSCGIALPYVMEYNMPLTQNKIVEVGKAMGLRFENISLRMASLETIEAVRNLLKDLDMPTSLKAMGIGRSEIEEMTEKILSKYQYLIGGNPRQLKKENLTEMYEKMWKSESFKA